jgi:hypothetical protein
MSSAGFGVRFVPYTISGLVLNQNNAPVSNAVINFTGPSVSGLNASLMGWRCGVSSSGLFVIKYVPSGTFTITPELAGATFTPSSKTIVLGSGSISVGIFRKD